ncbi:MAG: chemotaxis protein [Micropepsaceae bacterium]
MRTSPTLTGHERTFDPGDVIVTKTDLKGRITYANRVFLGISQLELSHTLDAPHSLIRHPSMPRCVFKLLWERIEAGKEIFAYVINRAMNGDHYWVFAHVTPSFGPNGEIAGYHSNRRVPDRRVIDSVIKPLYDDLCGIEQKGSGRKDGITAAYEALHQRLQSRGLDYDRFIFSN